MAETPHLREELTLEGVDRLVFPDARGAVVCTVRTGAHAVLNGHTVLPELFPLGNPPLPFNGFPPGYNRLLGPDDTLTTGPSPWASLPQTTPFFPPDPQAPTPPMLPPHTGTGTSAPVSSADPVVTPPPTSSAPAVPPHGTTGGHGRVHGRDYGSARAKGILRGRLKRG